MKTRLGILLLVALLGVATAATGIAPVAAQGTVAAQDTKDLDEIARRINELAKQAEGVAGERTAAAEDVIATKARLDVLLVEKGRAEADLALVQDEVRLKQVELIDLRNKLRDSYLHLERTRISLSESEVAAKELVRASYMAAGEDRTSFALVAGQVNELSLGMAYLSRVSQRTDLVILQLEAFQQAERRESAALTEDEAIVSSEADLLAELEDDLADKFDEVAERESAVATELSSQQTLLNGIDAEIAEIEGELKTLEAEQDRIKKKINEAAGPPDGTASDGGGGGWYRPVPGRISSGFGPRYHPILHYSRMHTGLDMSASSGDPIRATASGTVILAGWNGGYGNTIVVNHGGGITSLYAHQSQLGASVGQKVSAGDVVGYIGSTGLSTGPHLHFEIRVNGVPVDPLPYL